MKPALFGIKYSNRDFSKKISWGKNQFNNAFPIALINYMDSISVNPIYLSLNKELQTEHSKIDSSDIYGISPSSNEAFYAFETEYSRYNRIVDTTIPRIDVVVHRLERDNDTEQLNDLEVKLTALPDHTTADLTEDEYSVELVIRPDTIVYLAFRLAFSFIDNRKLMGSLLNVNDYRIKSWSSILEIAPLAKRMAESLDNLLTNSLDLQKPLLLQPVWKSEGKKLILADDCLDVFVWSDFAFTRLFVDATYENSNTESINRLERTTVWLFKMLYDFAKTGKIQYRQVIDSMSFDTKNDKAFALSGTRTYKYLTSPELVKPRIKKSAIKDIVLGGGENLLSPERRFDAAILSTPDLFE